MRGDTWPLALPKPANFVPLTRTSHQPIMVVTGLQWSQATKAALKLSAIFPQFTGHFAWSRCAVRDGVETPSSAFQH